MTDSPVEFNPSAAMVALRGGVMYLPVSARKVWLQSRTDHALDAAYAYTIHTEPHVINENVAVFRAEVTITDESGAVLRRATGWGSKGRDTHDYVEFAETKALGRALANCGFGTDNTDDDPQMIVDAPRDANRGPVALPPRQAGGAAPATGDGPTNPQWGKYQALCRERNVQPRDRATFTRRTMSEEIDRLINAAPAGAPEPDEPVDEPAW